MSAPAAGGGAAAAAVGSPGPTSPSAAGGVTAAPGGAEDPTADMSSLTDADRVKDISKSPAFAFLDECVRKQILTPGQVAMYKRQYEKVHEAVLQNYANETKCLAQSKSLKLVLESERMKLDKRKVQSQETQAENESLGKEEKETDTGVKFMEDEKDMLTREMEDLLKQKDEGRRRVEEKHRKGIEELLPTIDNLKKSIDDLRKDIQTKTDAIRGEIKESQKKSADIEFCQQAIAKNASLIEAKKHELNQAFGEPDRLKHTIEQLKIQAIDLEKTNETKATDIAKLEAREHEELQSIQASRNAWTEFESASGGIKDAIAAEQDRVREVQRALDFARTEFDEDCLTLQKMDERIGELKGEEKSHSENLKERQKMFRDVKKEYESAARIIATYQSQIPSLQREVEAKKRDLEEKRAQLRLQKAMADEIHQDIELFYSQALAQEKIDEDTRRQLDGVLIDKKELELKITLQLTEEKTLNAQIAHLRNLRDNAARESSKAWNEKREMEENLKMKHILLLDLRKQYTESSLKLQKSEHDYEYIKNLANRTINLTQTRGLALTELKDRIKNLQHEEEIQKNELRARTRALQDQSRQIKIAQTFLSAYQLEQNKFKNELKSKKENEDSMDMEIKKLLSIIELAEKEMVRLRDAYARAVDRRNFTGIQLIDRNDELYVLYEKHDIQSQQLKNGDQQTKMREGEIAELDRQIGELKRRIEVVKKRVPSESIFNATTITLKQLEERLKKTRDETKVLCDQLENPTPAPAPTAPATAATAAVAAGGDDEKTGGASVTKSVSGRCRVLPGSDPEPEQLAAKIEVLEERLNDKKEQLLEKELVLDEVTSLSDKLRLQASEQRELTLQLAKKVNDYQARIRATNHKLMAAVSELSMYQAQAMKLEQTKSERTAALATARQRLAVGQAPTEDSEREWYRKQRDRIMQQEAMLNRSRYQRLVATAGASAEPLPPGITGTAAGAGPTSPAPAGAGPMARPRNTRAEDRPNAYIPEDLGLPKPYLGSLAPFKPSTSGANMRHVRKPVPKEVVL